MSDMFHKALMEDAARINVSQMTWKQVKQSHRRARGKADWKRRLLVYAASAAVLLILAIGVSGFVSPVMAKMLQKVPIIGELYSFNNLKLDQYASYVNSSATDKGITVTVPKAYYDGRRLLLIYAIEVPEGYEPIYGSQINLATTKIQLNGKPLSFQSAVGMDSLASANMYRGDVGWDLSSDQAPQNSMLTIPIDQVGTVKGNWTLSIPVSSEAIDKDTRYEFPKDASSTYDGITITVNKVSKGPVHTTIWMQVCQQLPVNDKPKYELGFRGMDFVVYTPSRQALGGWYIGNQQYYAKKVGDEEVWDVTIQCKTPPNDIKSIIIEPVLSVEAKDGVTGNCPHLPQLDVTIPLN
ncbi:MAG: hypothetical protein A4E52_01318 [Pelotomaculum sp. PtaB.Bin013]|uniref:DUF4179 domain-containing protein n=1 Tax=Pelotomaculum isophthalicicum JI TaxID=947010 RepID=A0A9X4H0M1_9FIRM|nr:DUF4179 domain-containing protein [Pelotomaculum isophthalicicum]MDF9409937.1 DUF4179 domain-containing protein [Pelotomaculum isophthalicicum JI]OPX87848.1 MAG: hypothetical protein A4E52_01318 [Pelotomaculum sp. PtaB.Bin013]